MMKQLSINHVDKLTELGFDHLAINESFDAGKDTIVLKGTRDHHNYSLVLSTIDKPKNDIITQTTYPIIFFKSTRILLA